jgi:poly(A) polymerase
VIAKLRGVGHQAFLVGGCVRDLLLGVKPKDFDIATDARPDRIMDLFPRSGRVGAHFGVVLVRDVFDQVEVATFRSDHDYLDGRHPEQVRFESDPREDVLRRDFTINGLMMDPDTGEVLGLRGWARRSGARRIPPSATPTRDSAKIICGSCAPCGLRLASGLRSIRPPAMPCSALTL